MHHNIPEFKFVLDDGLDDTFLPTRSEPKATGWDVRCAEKGGISLRPFDTAKINLGFKAFPPEGWWFELKPRSSTFAKKNLHCLYGTIDQLYTGSAMIAVQWIPPIDYRDNLGRKGGCCVKVPDLATHISYYALGIDFGERIGQIIPVKRQEMVVSRISNDEFDKLCSEREGNRDGFGSSGDK